MGVYVVALRMLVVERDRPTRHCLADVSEPGRCAPALQGVPLSIVLRGSRGLSLARLSLRWLSFCGGFGVQSYYVAKIDQV